MVIADRTDGPLAVANNSGIPAYGSSYSYESETDLWAFAESIDVDPNPLRINHKGQQRYKWLIKMTHSSIPSDHSPNDSRENPLDDPPVVSGSFLRRTRPTNRDRNGNRIENTASDSYIPRVEREDALDTLRLEFNTATLNLSTRAQYIGKVNSDSIWGLQKRQAKMTRWDYQVLYAGTFLAYIRHSMEFEISFEQHPTENVCTGETNQVGWYTTRENAGKFYIPEGSSNKRPLSTKEKYEDHPPDVPQPLDCDGKESEDGTLYWNVFEVEEENAFLDIPGIPNPLPGPFV